MWTDLYNTTWLSRSPVIVVLDLETTVQKLGDKTDNSPLNPDNKAVSAHWLVIEQGHMGPVNTRVWHHVEKPQPDERGALQRDLDRADLIVAHNAKFDVMWLLEMGFRIHSRIYCTMVADYIYARGQRKSLKLADIAVERGVTHKKSELVDDYFKNGIGFEKMPLDTVIEYAEADVISCAEIYLQQIEELQLPENEGLRPIFILMGDMLEFLVEIELNGIKIDKDALEEVRQEFTDERDQLLARLEEIGRHVLGDTPFNLNSGVSLTSIVYSREVIERERHKQTFNLGVDRRGKPLRPPYELFKPINFARAVKDCTRVIFKTVAECCPVCSGSGKQYKVKKDGTPWKNQPKCKTCEGEGAVYMPTKTVAGLKLVPEGPKDASINGFKVDKVTIQRLITQAKRKKNDLAVEFLEKFSRMNAINSYLSSFIQGIDTWTRSSGFLHANFNQTVTATGRLSSSNPNFQNLPKGAKFPVRRVIVSRFPGGTVAEIDYSQLEFRIAGELSRDNQIINDVVSGKDVHKQTASIVYQIPESEVTKQQRNDCKKFTFGPLYGGQGADEEEHVKTYFREYFSLYRDLKKWHTTLMDGALDNGIVRIPCGREFYFPDVKRTANGRVTNATQIVNFPVQSHATGTIVPLACVRALRKFRELNLKSKLILTVHDSLVIDCYPGEVELVRDAIKWAMLDINQEIKERFNYEPVVPLDIEMEGGKNWMEMEPISLT